MLSWQEQRRWLGGEEIPNGVRKLGPPSAAFVRAVLWTAVRPVLPDRAVAARVVFVYSTRVVGLLAAESVRPAGYEPRSISDIVVPAKSWLTRQAASALIFVAVEQLVADLVVRRSRVG